MGAWRFFLILLVVFMLVVFFMNQSISSYLQQKYHVNFYPQNELLKEANALKLKLEQIRAILSNENLEAKENSPKEELFEDFQIQVQDENISKQPTDIELQTEKKDEKVIIKEGEEFLLIGDSLMQGVAFALKKDLKNLQIKATDLSKQSTGLSYKSYFNWANTLNSSLKNNKNFKYLVVLLGVNDPWDIKKAGSYVKFNSKEWLEFYENRVEELIKIAKNYGVKIFWYEIPPIKKEDLNKKVQILNAIYAEKLVEYDEIFIPTKQDFSLNDKFSTYIKDENNKSIKMRSADGIHFSTGGAKEMSKLLLERITKP